jgi:hypothetical protein
VYLKVSGSIVNNKASISVARAEIAKINIPNGLIQEYTPALNGFIDSITKSRMPSYDIQRLSVENGKVHFRGFVPDKEQAIKQL